MIPNREQIKDESVLLITAGICIIILSIFITSVLFLGGVGSGDLPFTDDTRTLPDPQLEISATYLEDNETVLLQVENGSIGKRSEYTAIFVWNPEMDASERHTPVMLKRGDDEADIWAARENPRLTSFPLVEGDSVTLIRIDSEDDDGDGVAGVDEGDRFEIVLRHKTGDRKIIHSFTIENNSVEGVPAERPNFESERMG